VAAVTGRLWHVHWIAEPEVGSTAITLLESFVSGLARGRMLVSLVSVDFFDA
jgi:hypothetical protein